MNKKEFLIPQLFFWELKSHISDEHNQPCVSYARLKSSTTILHSHKYTITLFLPTHYLWVLTDSQKPRGKRPLCTHDKLTSFDGSLHTLFWINNYDVTSVLAKAPLVPLGCILHPAAGSLLTEKGTKPQFHVLWRMKKNTGWARTTQTAHAASIIFLSCFALWCVLNLKFLCFSLNTQKVGITQDAGLGPLQVTRVIPCCVCVVIVWFGRSRQGHTEVLQANQMTARELEGLILWKCHEHTHTHVHSSESAYMYVTCNMYTLVFQPRSVICTHTDNKEIHCAYKHFHRKTWIFMKNTGYMQQTPDMPLSVCTRHSKIWPTLCVLAPLYHIGCPKELQDGQGQPLGTSQPHNKALSILQPAQTPCWNSPRFTFPEVHQFSAHITFPWSGAVCRQVLHLHRRPNLLSSKLAAPRVAAEHTRIGHLWPDWAGLGNAVLKHKVWCCQHQFRGQMFIFETQSIHLFHAQLALETRTHSTQPLVLPFTSRFILSTSASGHLERAIQNQYWLF